MSSSLEPDVKRSSSTASEPFSAERYYSTQPPPAYLEDTLEGVRTFVEANKEKGRRLVLVTSGGTTVPLELNVWVDPFTIWNYANGLYVSAFASLITFQPLGTRGATSAEYFLAHNYAVIFMHRQFSQQPFLRHYSHSTNPFLDLLEIEEPNTTSSSIYPTAIRADNTNTAPRISVNTSPEALPLLLRVLRENKRVKDMGTLHTVTFVTVDDYLFLLRGIAGVLGGKDGMGRMVMYYLAAAVSDFFLPRQKMAEHKIQSGKGSLHIEMDQVPKILKPLVNEWTPEGYIVSFKLETDPELLLPKARAALDRYGHQVVIGNELHTRKHKVVFIYKKSEAGSASGEANGRPGADAGSGYGEEWITIKENDGTEIEQLIVEKLVERHEWWINKGKSQVGKVL